MGLFDKRDNKKTRRTGSDDFDSPVEQIDLSAAQAAPPAPPRRAAPEPESEPAAAKPPPAPPSAQARRRREPEPELDAPAPDYGIEKAIALMRTLPADNVELVVQVVKHTLESTNIKIGVIIKDADRKQTAIQSRIKVLREEIADFESEIATRRAEIDNLDEDYRETTTVRERLELAQSLGKSDSDQPDGGSSARGGARPTTKPPAPGSGPATKPESAPGGDAPRAGGPLGARKPTTTAGTGPSKPSPGQKTTVVAKK